MSLLLVANPHRLSLFVDHEGEITGERQAAFAELDRRPRINQRNIMEKKRLEVVDLAHHAEDKVIREVAPDRVLSVPMTSLGQAVVVQHRLAPHAERRFGDGNQQAPAGLRVTQDGLFSLRQLGQCTAIGGMVSLGAARHTSLGDIVIQRR